jgi:hypothetical protein
VEHFDYVIVSCDVWKHLYSWYSADCTIVRFMKRDQANKKTHYLNLYPENKMYYDKGYVEERESEVYETESEITMCKVNQINCLED